MPLALAKFSAPGTITKFTVQLSASCQVGSSITSLSRFPAHLRMIWELPSQLWGSSSSSHSPWEQSGSWLYWLQCPPLLTGQSPPALWWCVNGSVHCLLSACWPHYKCCTFTGVLLLREIVFHTTFYVGHWPANIC